MSERWILDRTPGESEADYAAASEFWRRELGRMVAGIPIRDHLSAGRAVAVDLSDAEPRARLIGPAG